jgi:hypothetical protein
MFVLFFNLVPLSILQFNVFRFSKTTEMYYTQGHRWWEVTLPPQAAEPKGRQKEYFKLSTGFSALNKF